MPRESVLDYRPAQAAYATIPDIAMESGAAPNDVTHLLMRWKAGDAAAMEALTQMVYRELRQLAQRYLSDERGATTLQPTALVHELYVRLVSQELPDWESRGHFFGIAAHRMRQILVEHARKSRAAKRGSGVEASSIDDVICFAPERPSDIIALDDSLNALAAFDERKARVIELRYFAGLSVEETGNAMGISVATVGREQRLAEAWLRREMSAR
ncbi:MAG: sigma-70 family RNA polymerase sigma factor [Bryobacteraceae bacterium]|nr:sigma-70 family RNA polymerase sigma factor [Bryobacteraceae bacterium]